MNCAYCPFTVRGKVGIKTDFLPQLADRLKKLKEPLHLGLGTACEPYCEEEKEFRITRNAVTLAVEKGMPVQIFTKSGLILRDADLLAEYSEKACLR